MKILITGVPAAGKSTLSKLIEEKFNIKHFDLSKIIYNNKLYSNYNKNFDTYEFDENKIKKYLKKKVINEKCFIIDTHTPNVASNIKFDIIFKIRADFQTLRERYRERQYNEKKIEENIDAEAFDEIGFDLIENFDENKIIELKSCDYLDHIKLKFEDAIKILINKMKN